jgi:hypothetical protein
LAAISGVALAVNGLDVALEKVGLGAGDAHERLLEAKALSDHDLPAAAVEHAASGVVGFDSDEEAIAEALANLDGAIAKLNTIEEGSEHSAEVRGNVALMLQWIMDHAELVGSTSQPGAFAEGISEMAQEISDGAGDANESAGPPDETPVGPPEGVTPPTP